MAFPVIDEKYLDEFSKPTVKEVVKEIVSDATTSVKKGVAGILDFFIILVAAFWYFFFTGLAIVLNRKLPKEWMKLGTHLGMSRVSSLIQNASQNPLQKVVATKNAPKRQFKVLDIDTKRPFKVMKSVK